MGALHAIDSRVYASSNMYTVTAYSAYSEPFDLARR